MMRLGVGVKPIRACWKHFVICLEATWFAAAFYSTPMRGTAGWGIYQPVGICFWRWYIRRISNRIADILGIRTRFGKALRPYSYLHSYSVKRCDRIELCANADGGEEQGAKRACIAAGPKEALGEQRNIGDGDGSGGEGGGEDGGDGGSDNGEVTKSGVNGDVGNAKLEPVQCGSITPAVATGAQRKGPGPRRGERGGGGGGGG